MKMFEVGGIVRDEIMGHKSDDIDFSVVLEPTDMSHHGQDKPFEAMVNHLEAMGFKIFLETPEHFTVRAQFPKKNDGRWNELAGMKMVPSQPGLTADFVLARKEGVYTDGRRPDSVSPGTLMDDLARRDFTMNAIAKDSEGTIIDPFNGRHDIDDSVIRAVGDPMARLSEDALRAVRALRFSVTKHMNIAPNLMFAMESAVVLKNIETKISDDRITKELSKMFRFDTVASIKALSEFRYLTEAMFAGSVSLDSTMKTKGRGK